MTKDFVECPEVTGKTIRALKLYEDDTEGCETLIEFTDGTSFSSSVSYQPTVKGTLLRAALEPRRLSAITSRRTPP